MPRTSRQLLVIATLAATPLFVAGALRFGFDPVAHEAREPLIHRDGGYVGSHACQVCHAEHHESWRRTFHATMTQRVTPATVQGRFDGQPVAYAGRDARPFAKDGRYFMDIPTSSGGRRTAEVALAVGSRRYQQYFERESRDGTEAFVRLPVLWHLEAQRWLHLNTVFLHPDSDDWDGHRSTWNENCIFCHNTGPAPRMANYADPSRLRGAKFDSGVGELGIACEACHGPGATHTAAHRDPVERYRAHQSTTPDPTIVNPARLDQERAVSACGQCHGQRLPEPISRIEAWLTTGPTFRAGNRLLDHVQPITPSTPVHGSNDPDLFRVRFWGDGTPRLTAYEFQGVTRSPCYRGGKLTCQSCHAMHTGDPRGQLRPDLAGDRLCTQCHEAIGRDVSAHTKHGPSSAGSSCVECHMPRIVYGIVDLHRSHLIEVPDARRDAAANRPHACTLCHADRTLSWSARELRRLWGAKYLDPAPRPAGPPPELADGIASLLAGDAVLRAVYAKAAGRADSAVDPRDTGAIRVHLAVTLGDGYPAVRWLAQRSLQSLEARLPIGLGADLARVDHCAGPEVRRRAVFGLLDAIRARAKGVLRPPPAGSLVGPDFQPDLPRIIELTNLQGQRVISIGE